MFGLGFWPGVGIGMILAVALFTLFLIWGAGHSTDSYDKWIKR